MELNKWGYFRETCRPTVDIWRHLIMTTNHPINPLTILTDGYEKERMTKYRSSKRTNDVVYMHPTFPRNTQVLHYLPAKLHCTLYNKGYVGKLHENDFLMRHFWGACFVIQPFTFSEFSSASSSLVNVVMVFCIKLACTCIPQAHPSRSSYLGDCRPGYVPI